jgi:hypothetical protein
MTLFKKCTVTYNNDTFEQLIGKAFSYVIRDGFVIVTCYDSFTCMMAFVEYEVIYNGRDIKSIEVSNRC